MKRLKNVRTEISLRVMAYNLKRVRDGEAAHERRRPVGAPSGLQKLPRLNRKSAGQPFHHVDGRAIDSALKRADICSVNICAMGQLLLRKPPLLSTQAQIRGQNISNAHSVEPTSALRKSPRRILYRAHATVDHR
jgi:hypothetical protein